MISIQTALIMCLPFLGKGFNYLPHTQKLPNCKQCKHFVPEILGRDELGHCRLFGDVDFVTGKKNYIFASLARNNENFCGKNGTYYVKAEGVNVKNLFFQKLFSS